MLSHVRTAREVPNPPFVIVAHNFGYVMIPPEEQQICAQRRQRGQLVNFKACANIPCVRRG